MSPGTPSRQDRGIALALFAAAFVVLLGTEQPVGFVRDESIYFASAESYARWYQFLVHSPGQAVADNVIVRFWDINHEHPALMKTLFGWSLLLFHEGLGWLRPAAALRLPAFAIAALIPALLYLFGAAVFGRKAGLFAALSFFCVPRQFFQAHLACFDMPIAAMWLLTVYAFWRAQTDRGWWLWTGVIFGLSLATKHNAFFLPLVLVPFALAQAYAVSRTDARARLALQQFIAILAGGVLLLGLLSIALGPDRFRTGIDVLSPHTAVVLATVGGLAWVLWGLRQDSLPTLRPLAALVAMGVFGPLLFVGTWPYLWHHPVDRIAWYLAFHAQHNHYTWFYMGSLLREPPFPLEYVVVVTALTVPISLFAPMVLGLVRSLARALGWVVARIGDRVGRADWTELLIAVNALASIAVISHPDVPHFGGVKHWFPSMPFLALLAGWNVSSVLEVGEQWLEERGRAVRPVILCVPFFTLLLTPAVIATWRIRAFGTSAYSELAGGLPGAASLGMQRQFWSNNVTGVLPWLNEHAPRGARIWMHEVISFRDYQRNGMLRPDLRPAGGPGDADIAVYQYHQEFREQEMDIWGAFGTQIPVTGLYLDETPQIVVYQRPVR